MIDIEIATDLIATAKDNDEIVLVTLVDGTRVSGNGISVNSKGVNIKVDGKVRSFGLKRIDAIDLVTDDDADEDTVSDDLAQLLSDGMTTAELAAIMSDTLNIALTPKELRVHLRALGMGVGKGRKYSLTPSAYGKVRELVVSSN